MLQIIFNIILTGCLISLALWISKKNPVLAGFLVSVPLSTLITLAFSKMQTDNVGNTFILAKSIFIAVPATLVFFVPFLLADRLKIPFWTAYFSGILLLIVSFFAHKFVMSYWFTS